MRLRFKGGQVNHWTPEIRLVAASGAGLKNQKRKVGLT